MKVIETTWIAVGAIQIQDHGTAFIVSYPSAVRGFNQEKVFNKAGRGAGSALRAARALVREQKKQGRS
jgi:hypothetical protein